MEGDKYIMVKIMKYRLLILLLALTSTLNAQDDNNKWHIKLNYASLAPQIHNDQWYVTDEGYHVHPRTEDYTPGVSISAEYDFLNRISCELMLLYGRPKAVLGIVDQNSTLEPVFEKNYNFLSIIISPNITLFGRERGKFFISPLIGWGMTDEVTLIPTFGPEVTWNSSSEIIYGGKAGFNINLAKNRIAFNAEVLYLTLSSTLTESYYNQDLNKEFGPFGILLGLSYLI